MSYPYPPRRASRRQYFLLGLFAGGISVASILLIASLAKPAPHPPTFREMALVCSQERLAWHSREGLLPARMESIPTTWVCTGVSK